MSIESDVQSPAMGSVPYESQQSSSNASGQTSSAETGSATQHSSFMLDKLYDLWDVDTSDVLERIMLSLNPLVKTPFLTNGLLDSEHVTRPNTIVNGKHPDIWGPVWIYFTMVFSVFISSTMSELINRKMGDYDLGLLTGTAGTLFAFTFVVPVIMWFFIQYFNLVPSLTLVQTICLYGYSYTVWIPAVLIAGSPVGASAIVGTLASEIFNWIAIAIAFLLSARFIYGNLYKIMASQASQAVTFDKTKIGLVLAAGTVIHTALALTVLLL